MASLGERIRKLRKEKGMTLQSLAGSELTKGMLSLIENNKANPSMESLAFIAERLEIDKNELLEDVSPSELRNLLQEVEKIYLKLIDDMTTGLEKIIDLIAPYSNLLSHRYESARLLEIYSRCLYYLKKDNWHITLDRAEKMYEELHLMNNSADIQLFRAMLKFNDHQYEESLKMLKHSRKVFDERGIVLDALKKLDFDYSEAILHMAIAEDEDAMKIIADAIQYSKEHQIFYKIDALYRLTAFHAMLKGDEKTKDYYIHKLRVFADFTDDSKMAIVLDLLEAHYFNSFKHDYDASMQLIDRNMEKYNDEETSQFFIEKGKALYGLGKFEEALPWLEKHKLLEFMHHPYDLLMNYEKDAYLALIYEKQGRHELALRHAKIAKDNAAPMPDLPYKKFIMDVFNQIQRH